MNPKGTVLTALDRALSRFVLVNLRHLLGVTAVGSPDAAIEASAHRRPEDERCYGFSNSQYGREHARA
jgi:hypothetical protein